MKKTILSLILVCLLLVSQTALADEHTHTSADWDMDVTDHWLVCEECGEHLDTQTHVLEDGFCSVCGANIWLYDDGSGCIECMDEYFNYTRTAYFDADGNITEDYRTIYTYDEDGFILEAVTYYNGSLSEEDFYTFNAAGEYVSVRQNYYYIDGSTGYIEFNEAGDIVKNASFDADGNTTFEETTEYTFNEYGVLMEYRQNGWFDDGTRYLYVYNEYGDATSIIFYDAEGNEESSFSSEYEYSEGGNMLSEVNYFDGMLMSEYTYTECWNEEFGYWYSYLTTSIEYNEDGSYCISEYDENYTSLYDREYDANGVLLSETTYDIDEETYSQTATTTFSDGSVTVCVYSDYGLLTSETLYAADGSFIEETIITYDEETFFGTGVTTYADGTGKTSEYDDFGTLLKETYYAADGTVTDEIVYSFDEENAVG